MERWNDGRLIGQDKTGKDGEVDVCVERERERERKKKREKRRRIRSKINQKVNQKSSKNQSKIDEEETGNSSTNQ